MNGFVANGNQNGWPVPDATDPAVVESFMNGEGVEQAGLIRIPVCPASSVAPCCSNFGQSNSNS